MGKFIHSADWHIGATCTVPGITYERQLEVIDRIIDLAVERNISTVIVSGDVFDVDEPDPVIKEAFLQRVLSYDRMGIRLLVIRGNHDTSTVDRSAIRYLAHMTDHGVFKHSVFAERTQYVRVGDTIFILLNHRPRFFKEDIEDALQALHRGSLQVECKNTVLVAHECIQGALSDTNYRMHGEAIPVSIGSQIPETNVTYVALGDIHQKQRMAPRAFYPGAPVQVKFGDSWPKGVLVVDTETPDNPEFVPITSKRLVKIVADGDILPVIPEDAFVKFVASVAQANAAQEAGLLTDDVVKFEATKETVAIEYTQQLDLQGKVLAGLEQMLQAEELELGKREAVALFSAAGLV